MHRAVLLLVLVAAAAMAPPAQPGRLSAVNPWLSACDLSDTDDIHDRHERVCDHLPVRERARELSNTYLRHCRERSFMSALSEEARKAAIGGGATCQRVLGDVRAADDIAAKASQDLDSILARYDCGQTFSVIHKCSDCQESYRRWVCSALLPLFVSGPIVGGAAGGTGGGRGTRSATALVAPPPPRQEPPPPSPPRKRSTTRDNYKLYASNNKNTKLKTHLTNIANKDNYYKNNNDEMNKINNNNMKDNYGDLILINNNDNIDYENVLVNDNLYRSNRDYEVLFNTILVESSSSAMSNDAGMLNDNNNNNNINENDEKALVDDDAMEDEFMFVDEETMMYYTSHSSSLHNNNNNKNIMNNNNNDSENNNNIKIRNHNSDENDSSKKNNKFNEIVATYSNSSNIANGDRKWSNHRLGGNATLSGLRRVTEPPWNDRGHARTEQRRINARKDLDNRLGAMVNNEYSDETPSTNAMDSSESDRRKRRRRNTTSAETGRYRLRPCLAVCQDVERTCPYFLPGDRAPSYPTQYAGEPTFLCLDPNIEETGEQLRKSNYGDMDCCYVYCGPSGDSICPRCHRTISLPSQDQPNAPQCSPASSSAAQTTIPVSSGQLRTTSPNLVILILALSILCAHFSIVSNSFIFQLKMHSETVVNNIYVTKTIFSYFKYFTDCILAMCLWIVQIIECFRL